MKFFICIVFCVFAFTVVAAKPAIKTETENVSVDEDADVDATRFRKAAYGSQAGYGGSYVPAPPCHNAYLFSCSSHVNNVPCAQQTHSGYGSQGAYSAQVANVVPYYQY